MAALKHVRRQYVADRTNEFYEAEGFANEEKVRARIEESQKKRKRASIKA